MFVCDELLIKYKLIRKNGCVYRKVGVWGKKEGSFSEKHICLEGANYLCSALSIPAISVMIKVLS